MSKIDCDISEHQEMVDYVATQFPKTLKKIQVSINEFTNNPDENHPHEKTKNEICAYADELKRLVETKRWNGYIVETLEEIKEQDY